MRKLLNVLYVTTPESYLAKDGENIVVLVENKESFRIPIHNLEGIVCFGYMGASPALMGFCAERNVFLSFLTEHGRFLARVSGALPGNVLLRRKQYRIADDEGICISLAVNFITAKIVNCRTVLQRGVRDHGDRIDRESVEKTIDDLMRLGVRLDSSASLDYVRGIEGEAAKYYFSSLDNLILEHKDSFYLRERSRRPARDNMNSLLSFLYVLLTQEVRSALETVGLDSAVGFLHRDRPGRPSLALDLMEELRPYMVDRLALSLVNRRQVLPDGFQRKESGGIIMDDKTRKTAIVAWQQRKSTEIMHPFLKEKIPIGLLPYVQALLLARHIRGDIDGYPPFFWKS
jgi:CRISPR-associated protein Cas1